MKGALTDRPIVPAATASTGTPRKSRGQPIASAPSLTIRAAGSGSTSIGKGSTGGSSSRRRGGQSLDGGASWSGGGPVGSISAIALTIASPSARPARKASRIGPRSANGVRASISATRRIASDARANASAEGAASVEVRRASNQRSWGVVIMSGYPLCRATGGSSRVSRGACGRRSHRAAEIGRRPALSPGPDARS